MECSGFKKGLRYLQRSNLTVLNHFHLRKALVPPVPAADMLRERCEGVYVSLVCSVPRLRAAIQPRFQRLRPENARSLAHVSECPTRSARTDAQKAAKVLRLEAATVNYFARFVRYQASLIRTRGRNSNERLHTALCGIADVARKFILLNMPDVALDKINLVLESAPDHLMLNAVRACALLITGNQEARDVLRRHRGQFDFDKGIRWEKIVLDQIRQLRKAPGMNAEILSEVASPAKFRCCARTRPSSTMRSDN